MRQSAAVVAGLMVACGFDATGGGTPQESVGSSTTDVPLDSSSSGASVPDDSSGSVADSSEATSAPAESSDATLTSDDTTTTTTTDSDEAAGTTDTSTGGTLPAPWCDPNWPDLVACYAFADLDGGVLVDDAAAGNDGTISDVGIEAGPLGEAAVFSGASQASVPAHAATNLASALTMELFLRVDAIPGSGRAGVLDRDGQWSLFVFADGRLRCGGSSFAYWDGPTIGEWMHVGCVVGDGFARIFVDGALVAEVADPGPIATGNGNPLAIGDNSPGFDEPLAGAISGVRIWSVTRTAEELCEAAGELCS